MVYYQATDNVIVFVVIAPASVTGARAQQKVTPPKKTVQGDTALVPQDGGVATSACKRVPQEQNAGENLTVQTTGPQAVDSECDSTTSDELDEPRGGGESKSEEEDSKKEESNNPLGDSKPSEHARLNKVKKEVAPRIWQLTLQDRVLINTISLEQQTKPMASDLAGLSRWTGTRTDSIMLKAAHLDPFYGGNLKAKIFLQQVDNKIANAAGAFEEQRIRYMISLLRGPAVEWAATYMDNKGYTTFKRYGDLKKKFFERFTDPNPSGTALAQLL